MASVWYVGGSDRRVITKADWASLGEDQETSTWDKFNGFSLPQDSFSPSEVEKLRQMGFQPDSPDGPRPGSAVLTNDTGEVTQAQLATAIAALDTRYAPVGDVEALQETAIEQGYLPAGFIDGYMDEDGRGGWGMKDDGTFHIFLPVLAGVQHLEIPSEQYTEGMIDENGRLGETVLGEDGRILDVVMAEWKRRMGPWADYPIDVVVVAGQSNGTPADVLPETVNDPDELIKVWNSALDPLQTNDDSLGASFARERVKANPRRRVLLVYTAVGSTAFTSTSVQPPPEGLVHSDGGTWDRNLDDPKNLYDQMIAKTAGALAFLAAAGIEHRLLAVLWSQGEGDRDLTESQYAGRLDDLITAARVAWSTPTLPFLIGSMVPEALIGNGDYGLGVQAALADTPRRIQRTAYFYGPDNMLRWNDSRIHFSAQGQRVRGALSKLALTRAQLNVAAAFPVPPQNLRVHRSGGQAVIEWDHPDTRVTTYGVSTSIDNGVTWTAATLTAPLTTRHEIAVPAATPLWVTARTVNEVGASDYTQEVHA